MAKLYDEYDGEQYFDNPRRRRRRRKGSGGGRAKSRHVARRKRGSGAVALMNPRHRKHSRHRARHNPPSFGGLTRGLTGRLMEGVKGGAGVIAGKLTVRTLPRLVKLPTTGILGVLIQVGVGVLAAPFVDRFAKGFGKPFLYGALAAPMESALIQLNVPIVGPALSSYNDELAALPTPGATGMLPARTEGAIGSYGSTIGEEEDVIVQ